MTRFGQVGGAALLDALGRVRVAALQRASGSRTALWGVLLEAQAGEPYTLLTALNTGHPALMGGPHVPVRGQYLAAGDDLLVIAV